MSIRIPYGIAYVLCRLWEKYSKWSKNQLPPVFNRRRCSAEWKGNVYSNRKLREQLGWRPRVPLKQAMETFLAQFGAKSDDGGRTTENGRTIPSHREQVNNGIPNIEF